MNSIAHILTAAAIALTMAPVAFAQDTKAAAVANADVSQGEVRKIDAEAGKLTIKHGELKSINMPPMTMVFTVSDKAALSHVKPGDNITFVATKTGAKLIASNIAVVK